MVLLKIMVSEMKKNILNEQYKSGKEEPSQQTWRQLDKDPF